MFISILGTSFSLDSIKDSEIIEAEYEDHKPINQCCSYQPSKRFVGDATTEPGRSPKYGLVARMNSVETWMK